MARFRSHVYARLLMVSTIFVLCLSGLTSFADEPAAPSEEKPNGAPPNEESPKKDTPKEDIYGVDEATQTKIDRSIEAGKAYLIRQQQRGVRGKAAEDNGAFPKLYRTNLEAPLHSFLLYTLVASGVDPEDDVFSLGMACKKRYGKFQGNPHMNYGYAVHVLFQASWMKACEWKYKDAPRLPRSLRRRIRTCKESIRDIVKAFEKNRSAHIWRYPGPWPGSKATEDLSAAQYVMLAIKAAARVGVITPKKACALCKPSIIYLLEAQESTGPEVPLKYLQNSKDSSRYGTVIKGRAVQARGWSYVRKEQANAKHQTDITGSMTAAGVACLAIAKELLILSKAVDPVSPKDRTRNVSGKFTLKDVDDGILSGWAKLGEMFTVSSNPGNASWHYYWLYGVERAGALLGVPNMGKHRWYKTGAKYLLGKQDQTDGNELGRWPGATERTCFALLFLKRATKPPVAPILPPITTD